MVKEDLQCDNEMFVWTIFNDDLKKSILNFFLLCSQISFFLSDYFQLLQFWSLLELSFWDSAWIIYFSVKLRVWN